MKSLKLFTLLQKAVSDLNTLARQLQTEQIDTPDAVTKAEDITTELQDHLKE